MLDDLFSSSKGPGVIGLLLGLFVLAGFCGLGFAVFDGRLNGDFAHKGKKESASNDQRIVNLKTQISTYIQSEDSWKKLQEDAKKAGQVQRAVTLRKPKVGELQAEVEAETRKNEAALAQWETYKEQYRAFARESLVGKELENLVTADGKTFANVKVTNVTPLEMKFSHANGATGIKLAVLDEKLKDYLQFSEEKAAVVAADIKKNTELLGASAKASQKIAALKARISHYNLNIERNNSKIQDYDRKKLNNKAESKRLRERARVNWAKYREDKAAGRPSRADDNARSSERLADNLLKANQSLNLASSKLRDENNDYRNKISEAEREMVKTRREAKDKADEAKEEREKAEAAGTAAPR